MGRTFFRSILFLFVVLSCTTGCNNMSQLGDASNPIKLYLSPSVDSTTIRSNSKLLLEYLTKSTRLHYTICIPRSNSQMIEDLGSGKADVAMINSYGFIEAQSKYGVTARLQALRDGAKVYQGQIIVRKDRNINRLSDLNGKSFAFTDERSTSGFLFPMKLLEDNKIALGRKTFAHQHDQVVRMVYDGRVDAGATYYSPATASGLLRDARSRLIKEYPDIANVVKILLVTESIPNDPLVFRKEIDKSIVDRITKALMNFSKVEMGENILYNIYGINGFTEVDDNSYKNLKQIINMIREKNKQEPLE